MAVDQAASGGTTSLGGGWRRLHCLLAWACWGGVGLGGLRLALPSSAQEPWQGGAAYHLWSGPMTGAQAALWAPAPCP